MPKAAHRAVQAAVEWKKNPPPHADSAYFECPTHSRLHRQANWRPPEEIALTTGASTGMHAVAYGLTGNWHEILTAKTEFSAPVRHVETMEAREGIVLKNCCASRSLHQADDSSLP